MSDDVRRVPGPELSAAQLHDLLRLRVDVFVVEQDCPYHEIDGRDLEAGTVHYWSADATGPTSVIRVLDDGDARRIGRVVTRADARGRGLSRRLIDLAVAEWGGRRLVLDAQSHLEGFYASFGFTTVGPEFLEDGIPHLPMARNPAPA